MVNEDAEAAGRQREAELVDKLTALDGEAWRALFDAHHTRVFGYAFVRLGNASDAEDVTSAVFTAAVRGIRSFRYRGVPVTAWLMRIAHHETVDALNRRKRQPAALDGAAPGEPAAAGEYERTVDRLDVGHALGQLKQEQRDVLLLRFFDDCTIRETADLLQKSEGAVKVLQLRALRSLRTRLGGR